MFSDILKVLFGCLLNYEDMQLEKEVAKVH